MTPERVVAVLTVLFVVAGGVLAGGLRTDRDRLAAEAEAMATEIAELRATSEETPDPIPTVEPRPTSDPTSESTAPPTAEPTGTPDQMPAETSASTPETAAAEAPENVVYGPYEGVRPCGNEPYLTPEATCTRPTGEPGSYLAGVDGDGNYLCRTDVTRECAFQQEGDGYDPDGISADDL